MNQDSFSACTMGVFAKVGGKKEAGGGSPGLRRMFLISGF